MPSIGTITPALRRLARTLFLALAGLLILSGSAHAFSCPGDKVKEGALCYNKPRSGYTCTATLCVENCREGYHSTGIGTCHFSGSTTYTLKPYATRSHSGMQRCLALFYNDCRASYHMDVCGICSYKGAWDITRASYDRGPGTNPDVSAAFRQVSITAQTTYGRALFGAQDFYNQSLQAFTDGMTDLVKAKATSEATNFVTNHKAVFTQIKSGFEGLQSDPEMMNVMRRLVVSAANGKADAQIAADIKTIADRVGATQLGSGWIFGVQGGISAAYAVGGYETIGIAVDLNTLSTAPNVAVMVNEGLSFGPAFGADLQLGIFVQQGKLNNQTWQGPTMGISLSQPAIPELNVSAESVSYQMATRWPSGDVLNIEEDLRKYFANGQWGFALSASVGVAKYPVSATVDFGTEFSFLLKP
jgi:hypothetical protein